MKRSLNTNPVNDYYVGIIESLQLVGTELRTRNDDVRRLPVMTFNFNRTPLVTVRKAAWRTALREWEWFMSGSSNVKDLHPSVHPWWTPWADGDGNVGYNYSHQFRRFGDKNTGRLGFDQLAHFIQGIIDHPNSRRHVMTTWNPEEMYDPDCPITNCHGTVIQAFVDVPKPGVKSPKVLHLYTYQRSVDVICGLPHNWIQYWAFVRWLAHRTDCVVGDLIWTGGDVHLYDKHSALADKIITTSKIAGLVPTPPELVYTPTGPEFRADDFTTASEYKTVIEESAEMVV